MPWLPAITGYGGIYLGKVFQGSVMNLRYDRGKLNLGYRTEWYSFASTNITSVSSIEVWNLVTAVHNSLESCQLTLIAYH